MFFGNTCDVGFSVCLSGGRGDGGFISSKCKGGSFTDCRVVECCDLLIFSADVGGSDLLYWVLMHLLFEYNVSVGCDYGDLIIVSFFEKYGDWLSLLCEFILSK